jgi:hypothetical protein
MRFYSVLLGKRGNLTQSMAGNNRAGRRKMRMFYADWSPIRQIGRFTRPGFNTWRTEFNEASRTGGNPRSELALPKRLACG